MSKEQEIQAMGRARAHDEQATTSPSNGLGGARDEQAKPIKPSNGLDGARDGQAASKFEPWAGCRMR